jgi:hypothetical protein
MASAVENRDAVALEERVDWPALRRSLTKQVVATYLKLTGKNLPIGGKRLAVSVADPIVARLMTIRILLDLLGKGEAGKSAKVPTITLASSIVLPALATLQPSARMVAGTATSSRFELLVMLQDVLRQGLRRQVRRLRRRQDQAARLRALLPNLRRSVCQDEKQPDLGGVHRRLPDEDALLIT